MEFICLEEHSPRYLGGTLPTQGLPACVHPIADSLWGSFGRAHNNLLGLTVGLGHACSPAFPALLDFQPEFILSSPF